MLIERPFKRFYNNKSRGLRVMAGPVTLSPCLMFQFAQENDRISAISIFGRGMFYSNLKINLDYYNIEHTIFSMMRKKYGDKIKFSDIMRLMNPITGNLAYQISQTIDHTAYRYNNRKTEKKFSNHDWGNIAPYWWKQ